MVSEDRQRSSIEGFLKFDLSEETPVLYVGHWLWKDNASLDSDIQKLGFIPKKMKMPSIKDSYIPEIILAVVKLQENIDFKRYSLPAERYRSDNYLLKNLNELAKKYNLMLNISEKNLEEDIEETISFLGGDAGEEE